jgi:hypothetical protein
LASKPLTSKSAWLILTHHLYSNALDLFALSKPDAVGIRPYNPAEAKAGDILTT